MSDTIQERWSEIRARMARACLRSGRDPSAVTLVAVSKKVEPARICEAAECGQAVFGESKVQEAQAKIPQCPGRISWQLVGHLQRNKAGAAAELFDLIHSVDSLRLLEALNRACEVAGKTMPVFLEVNVSGERSKFGLPPEAVPEILRAANGLMSVNVMGFMTIPPFSEDPEKARPFFRRLRELRDQWGAEAGAPFPDLSMGMTQDFEVAIEEGATYVRVGTALFGERSKG